MKVIRNSSADEVVLEWLKAELNSLRFGDDLRVALAKMQCDDAVVLLADLRNVQENQKR